MCSSVCPFGHRKDVRAELWWRTIPCSLHYVTTERILVAFVKCSHTNQVHTGFAYVLLLTLSPKTESDLISVRFICATKYADDLKRDDIIPPTASGHVLRTKWNMHHINLCSSPRNVCASALWNRHDWTMKLEDQTNYIYIMYSRVHWLEMKN